MKIAYDIDDTLGDFSEVTFKYLNLVFGQDITFSQSFEKVRTLSLGRIGIMHELYAKMYNSNTHDIRHIFATKGKDFLFEMKPYPKAIQSACSHFENGDEIFYISARDENCRAITQKWLEKNGFPKGTLIFAEEKEIVVRKEGIQRFYDDSVDNIGKLIKMGVSCHFVVALQNWHHIQKMKERGVEILWWNEMFTPYEFI